MAQYKVPQDVEAEDKLLGPFTFRQLIYLFVAAGLIVLAVFLFGIFPLLCIIPVPFILFLLALALPLRKDQPMETYILALISFYTKPNKRFWNPGQRESTIIITAPKKIEGPRIRTLSEDEASHRLSFLAEVIDSEGKSVTGKWNTPIREEYIAEASAMPDMFDDYTSLRISDQISTQTAVQHSEAVEKMRAVLEEVQTSSSSPIKAPTINRTYVPSSVGSSVYTVNAAPSYPSVTPPAQTPEASEEDPKEENPAKAAAMAQLANNSDLSIATIEKEANRIEQKEKEKEVFISLH